jgi:drug/metabolite transporter (DMT)-like permease
MMQPIIGPKVVSVMKSTIAIGMMLLVVGNLFSAMYDVSIKWLPEGSSAATFLLIRQLTSVLMLLPLWFAAKKPISRHIKVHLVRANTGAIGAVCLIMGLIALPIATVSSLFYSAPLMIVLMGFLFLKESVTAAHWLAAILGFLGIIICYDQVKLTGLELQYSSLHLCLR